MRYSALITAIVMTLVFLTAAAIGGAWWLIGVVLFGPLALLGIYDVLQVAHSITRNYPLLGHLRFIQEAIAPEIHQYFIEGNTDGRPFDRDQRSLVYERSKNISGLKPFGTELDVYRDEYEWLSHSMMPQVKSNQLARTTVGGPACRQPYSCSLLNVSAMSFGALSPTAIEALNLGAKLGGFYHCTGEGGLSDYHRAQGGDLVWQIGTGYFGCRTRDGKFDADLFQKQAGLDQVKMIEIKISQGAKPGHGGVLPADKITAEIARIRGVPMGEDCVSPPSHSSFNSPRELCDFIAQLRELSGGKPVGFKLCVGRPIEFLSACKAMIETGVMPDFITVDGSEGGTGAAPIEFSDSLGTPLREGLVFVHNALMGCGLRDKIRIAASGKVTSAAGIAKNLALGADWCNVARGFMLSVGCIQAQACHTNKCPVGVATQDPARYRAVDVKNKGQRAFHFHKNTLIALNELVAAAGLHQPNEFRPSHVFMRLSRKDVISYDEAFHYVKPGSILDGSHKHPVIEKSWDLASPDCFDPTTAS